MFKIIINYGNVGVFTWFFNKYRVTYYLVRQSHIRYPKTVSKNSN